MATASAVQSPRRVLHTRGAWSARDDRAASAIWLAILWVGIITGFGLDFPRFLHQNPPAPPVIRIHAVIFTAWMLLLTTQVLLVLRNRVAWHRKFGWFAVFWACLMAVFGPWAAIAARVTAIHTQYFDSQLLALNLVDILGFLVLLVWGIALRKNPAAHRRMMILSTVSLADPGFNRLIGYYVPEPSFVVAWFFYVFYGNLTLIALMAAWDWWRGRLMRSFVIGAAALIAAEFVCSLLYFWVPWKTATTEFLLFWAKHFA